MSAIYRFVILAVVLLTPLPVLAQWGGGGRMVLPQASSQTIASTAISCGSSCSATAGTGGQVGTFSATMSPASPAFSGSWSLQTTGSVGGTSCDNSGFFSVSGNALNISSSSTAATYHPCYVATQSGISNSPLANIVTVTVSSGGGGTSVCNSPAVPHPAQAAGFTTLAYCADFTQQSSINNVTQSGTAQIENWTGMGWLDCSAPGTQGPTAGKQWENYDVSLGAGQPNPCGAKSVALDSVSGVNALQLTAISSDGLEDLGITTGVDPCSSATTQCYESFPVTNGYFEINWRSSQSEIQNNIVDKGNVVNDFWAWWSHTTNNNGCGTEVDFFEIFNFFYAETGWGPGNYCGGSGYGGSNSPTADSSYHVDGDLVTANGRSAADKITGCGYHDGVGLTCGVLTGPSPYGPTVQQGYLALTNSAAHVNAVTGPVHMWVAWLRVWSCAGWNTTGDPKTTSNTCNTPTPFTTAP